MLILHNNGSGFKVDISTGVVHAQPLWNSITKFDALTEQHKVYKVLTTGDSYMAVAGAPTCECLSRTAYQQHGSRHENCDALSQIPLPTESTKTPAPAECVKLIQMLDDSPITSADWTPRDPVLSRVQMYVLTG